MKVKSLITRPETLTEGQVYLLLENNSVDDELTVFPVTFVAYTPCPAVVIVRNGEEKNLRCPRESLIERESFEQCIQM